LSRPGCVRAHACVFFPLLKFKNSFFCSSCQKKKKKKRKTKKREVCSPFSIGPQIKNCKHWEDIFQVAGLRETRLAPRDSWLPAGRLLQAGRASLCSSPPSAPARVPPPSLISFLVVSALSWRGQSRSRSCSPLSKVILLITGEGDLSLVQTWHWTKAPTVRPWMPSTLSRGLLSLLPRRSPLACHQLTKGDTWRLHGRSMFVRAATLQLHCAHVVL
jgi:hypothetical protein